MLGLGAGLIGGSATALADEMGEARAAYERGAKAYQDQRYTEAAREFARADELVANSVTLESALKAALKGDDPALGMNLVERAEKRGKSASLAAAASKAREQFGKLAGRLSVACPDARPCSVKVDGTPAASGQGRWVSPGNHRVEVTVAGAASTHTVAVAAAQNLDWKAPPSEGTPASSQGGAKPPSNGLAPKRDVPNGDADLNVTGPSSKTVLAPAWFFASLGVTLALGGVATWSLVDTLGKHNDYVDGKAEAPDGASQLRTNILLGVTGAAVVGTVVTGVLAFSRTPARSAAMTITLGAGRVSLTARY